LARLEALRPRAVQDPDLARAVESIGANVRRLRLKNGLTQEKLAELLDLTLVYVQMIERGAASPSLAVLVKFARALGVNPGALFKPAKRPEVKRGRPRKKKSAT
jgi:transcriptional regulator with XRE-family HTH domain